MGDPGALEVLHVVAVDLGQRRIAAVRPVAADGGPFLAGRLAQVGRLLRPRRGGQAAAPASMARMRNIRRMARLPVSCQASSFPPTMPQVPPVANAVRAQRCRRCAGQLMHVSAAANLAGTRKPSATGHRDGPAQFLRRLRHAPGARPQSRQRAQAQARSDPGRLCRQDPRDRPLGDVRRQRPAVGIRGREGPEDQEGAATASISRRTPTSSTGWSSSATSSCAIPPTR